MFRVFLACGAISAFLAVAAGAFGAHALRARLSDELLSSFETAARYQMFHALALVMVALSLAAGSANRLVVVSGWLFIAGTLLFSGSLYLLSLTGQRWLGAITPLGGVAWLIGWALIAYTAIRP